MQVNKNNNSSKVSTKVLFISGEIDGDTDQFFFGVIEGEANLLASSSNSSRSRLTREARLPTSIYKKEKTIIDGKLNKHFEFVPNAKESLPPDTRSCTNRYNPRVIVDCTVQDWAASSQNIVDTSAYTRSHYFQWLPEDPVR